MSEAIAAPIDTQAAELLAAEAAEAAAPVSVAEAVAPADVAIPEADATTAVPELEAEVAEVGAPPPSRQRR